MEFKSPNFKIYILQRKAIVALLFKWHSWEVGNCLMRFPGGGGSFVRREKVPGRVAGSPRAKHCIWEVQTPNEAYPECELFLGFVLTLH